MCVCLRNITSSPVIRCQRNARKLPTSSPEPTFPPAVISRSIGPTAQNDTPFQKKTKKQVKKGYSPVIRCQRHARKLPTSFPEPTVPPAVISCSIGPMAQNDTPFQKTTKKERKRKQVKKNKKGCGVRGKGGRKGENAGDYGAV
ncbi:hypothetical protein CDAR_579861 [Caerostris darwini]|uniref:Uncharacterized protein n=1 Tax=Caerostris darwini TaxID=1538125 RepID=A0AAV4PTX2_9ARAC|nr:hypothetical protein CDAR_579861 [Caerostris darwini]